MQGTYAFLNLTTGSMIKRRKFESVEDNAVEPEPATFPDIPAEMPGVERESSYEGLPVAPSPESEAKSGGRSNQQC